MHYKNKLTLLLLCLGKKKIQKAGSPFHKGKPAFYL